MKHLVLSLLACILCLGCTQSPPFEEELSSFLSTRALEPLENTIWEHQTGEEYNRYILFQEGEASLFYGFYGALPKALGGNVELQRWSDFYSSPYFFVDGKVITSIEYPLWGEIIPTEKAEIVKAGEGYTLCVNEDIYTYFGPYTDTIEGMWMIIHVGVNPWE